MEWDEKEKPNTCKINGISILYYNEKIRFERWYYFNVTILYGSLNNRNIFEICGEKLYVRHLNSIISRWYLLYYKPSMMILFWRKIDKLKINHFDHIIYYIWDFKLSITQFYFIRKQRVDQHTFVYIHY